MPISSDLMRDIRDKMRDPNLPEAEVAMIFAEALKSAGGALSSDVIGHEIEGLVELIRQTREELTLMRETGSAGAAHLPNATDELDAVISATEDATNKIMTCAEEISGIAAEIGGEQAAKLDDISVRLFEACSFQDITGQRIIKVVRALKVIDDHLGKLLGTLGETKPVADSAKTGTDRDLMNGPQLPGNATSQDEIDALLSSFDAPPK